MPQTKNADIVFCLDTSASMQPCIEAVKTQISSFVETFQESSQLPWDLRLGLLAHRATVSPHNQDAAVVGTAFLDQVKDPGLAAIYRGDDTLFTRDVAAFRRALAKLQPLGDEAMLFALDCVLDFPWRDASTCHRVVVMLTDESIEEGLMLAQSRGIVPELVQKIMNLRVMLFMVGPESALLEQLSMVDRSEWEIVGGYDGLRAVDFRKLLQGIARSVSVSNFGQQAAPNAPKKALFGQNDWESIQGVTFIGR
ncbi:hypothetical protein ACNOYE_39135 [Nannocystaceae bacterium ST9]